MANHSSASVRVETRHVTETTEITISDALRQSRPNAFKPRHVVQKRPDVMH